MMKKAVLAVVLIAVACASHQSPAAQSHTEPGARKTPEEWLARALVRFHERYDVYSDASAAGNHFVARGRMYGGPQVSDAADSEQAGRAVPPMEEDHHCAPRPGTCIRATFHPHGGDWGGWYLMTGVFPDPESSPSGVTSTGQGTAPGVNWGTVPAAGMDLTGATELSFWAAGERGGEVVDFFAFGVGRDEQGNPRRDVHYPDSSFRAPTKDRGLVRLTKDWRHYTIGLKGLELGYVLGGFGWVAAANENRGRDVVIYIDDVSYDLPRMREARFPLSYETERSTDPFDFDSVTRNTAFTYDAAVALIAFIAAGDLPNAKLIADALLYAQSHDRWYEDGRLRNAYQAGDLFLPPGWAPERQGWALVRRLQTVRMPGWYVSKDQGTTRAGWYEDQFHASSHTGNIAWAMLGLLSYWEATPTLLSVDARRPYLDAVVRLAYWLDDEKGCACKDTTTDSRGGYTGGWNGWEPSPTKIRYRATEHNIDLVAAFDRLSRATGDPVWAEDAQHAWKFVDSMWQEGKYLTGTDEDGTGVNKFGVIPVDVQAWAVLALGDRAHREALAYADRELRAGDGFGFSNVSRAIDASAVWYEGTAHMALAFRAARNSDGSQKRADELLDVLRRARLDSGALPAASKNGLDTGFAYVPGQKWLYYKRAHTGATAWAVLAERGVNPFAPARRQ